VSGPETRASTATAAGRQNRPADGRLVAPAVVTWIVAGVLVGAPGFLSSALAIGVGLLVVAAGTVFGLRRLVAVRTLPPALARALQQALPAAVVCAALCCAVAASALAAEPARTPHILTARAGGHVELAATVTTTASISERSGFGGESIAGVRFGVTIDAISAGGARQAAAAPALVFVDDLLSGDVPAIGSRVTLRASVRATEAGSQTAWLVFADTRPETLAEPPWYLGWAASLRSEFAGVASTLPGDGGQLAPGLALGDESLVSPSLDEAMKQSGLSHLTAVSGANCAIVVTGVLLFGAALRWPRGVRLVAALVVLGLFVVLVTPQPSVLRAAAMATIVLLSIGSSRGARGLPVLCLAVLVLLVADPWISRSYGFALSVLATAGLLLLTRPLTTVLRRVLPGWAAAGLAVPLAAQLACQPVLVLLAPTVSPLGVLANVLAAPAAPVATIVGLLACLVGALAPPLAAIGAWICWLPAAWIAAVARFFADLPAARLPWIPGAPGAAVIALITTLGLWALLAARAPRARRIVALVLTMATVGVYGGLLIGVPVAERISVPQRWQVAACDIGQGDAVLVRSGGRVALIDTGPDPALLAACLDRLGIQRLDLLVLTHYDLDHIGGVSAVEDMAQAALVGPTSDAADERTVRELRDAGAVVREARRGDSGTLGELRWSVLWPRGGGTLVGNPASVTLELSGEIDALFLGDLGEQEQNAVLATSALDRVDLVKVAHHGSADQSAALYDRVRATVGLISVGADNDYGHPNRRALTMLAEAGTRSLRTDRLGLILVEKSGGGLRVWTDGREQVGVGSSG
jgi:competence protein ComEC